MSCGNAYGKNKEFVMLARGGFQHYDDDRMVVRFTMTNASDEIACAISSAAMDDLEGSTGTKPGQREAQFLRLRDRIEERASRKFSAAEFEGTPPGLILRTVDFR
jgi:hypothetical protein